jgi:ABC-type multidrug transport system fused ATPase/permease subunit
VSEEDEDTRADSKTIWTIVGQVGGLPFVVFYFSINALRRYQWVSDGLNFGKMTKSAEGDMDGEAFKDWLFWAFFWSITLQMNYHFKDFMTRWSRDRCGKGIHNDILRKVMHAPINLFFDVTPIGTILRRFRDDIQVFKEHFMHAPSWCFDMSSHYATMIFYYYLMGCWEGPLAMFMGFWVLSYITAPYLAIDNQLHKNGSLIWTPIISYFHESMRGITVIKAFD